MKIVVVGDIVVPTHLMEEAARELMGDKPYSLKVIEWENQSRQEFQRRAQHLEKEGPTAEPAPQELYDEIEDADVLLTHFSPVPRDLIEKGKQLKLIGTCRGGMEHIDVQAATDHNIPVIHVIRNADCTSDFAVGLMFAETRNIARSHCAIKHGDWRKNFVNSGYTASMSEMVLGVVGLGHIGKLVAKKALGIGIKKVLAYDPFVKQETLDEENLKITLVDKEELYKNADIVSLHLRLTEETKNSVGEKELSLMKPTAYLINTSRAGVLERNAFIKALQEKTIGGAALDVFWDEPIDKDDPILELDNITMTAHLAGNVVSALPRSPFLLVEEIKQYWETGRSPMVVNLKDIKR